MSKAKDLAYFNIPILSGTTFDLGSNTLTATLAQLNAALSDADLISSANAVALTGDQTIGGTKTFSNTISGSINGNAATVTNGVYTIGNQTIGGTKTFSATISGSIDGNAATVTNGVYTTGDQSISGFKNFTTAVTSTLNFGNANAVNFTAWPLGTGQGQTAGYSLRATFQNTADNGARRAADIWAGYDGGAWGTEYLAFGVGDATDTANRTTERFRITTGGIEYRENIQVISTNTTALKARTYVLIASLTLTLPVSPTAGDWVKVINRSGTTTALVARNAQNIMSLAEDFTVDINNFSAVFVFADATRGWIIL